MAGTALRCEWLEDRCNPALTIDFDYRFDNGFFSDPGRRAAIQQAGDELASRISSTPPPLVASGSNTWSALLFHPATGAQTSVKNLPVPEGHITVFVGGRDLDGHEAGEGGSGGYSADGDAAWLSRAGRGWGGSIGFDTHQAWYTGTGDAPAGQTCLYTVATHELGHVLGIGTSQAFTRLINGQYFSGAKATTLYGSPPRLSADLAHLAYGTTWNGQPVSMSPYLQGGKRYGFSELDYALLADLGWSVTPKVASMPAATIVSPPPSSASLVAAASLTPFPGYTGEVRSATADMNGDGVSDTAYATGPGSALLRVVDGKSGADILATRAVFGADFDGGLFVAAADFDRDGRAEVIVSPDAGGGGRVSVFDLRNGVNRVGDFFGIDDVNFRGGARIAAADINGDGTPDIVVGAGNGGGPRIALFDGRSIADSKPRKLVSDFFAFPGEETFALRNGVYVAAGDFNGDGKAEIVFGAGPGGGPRVVVIDGKSILSGERKVLQDYFAFDSADRGGASVSVVDGKVIAN